MLITAELTERKNLKNTAEKTDGGNNFNRITENMSLTPLRIKNTKGKIVKKKTAKKASELGAYFKETLSSLPSSSLNFMQQKLAP